MVEIPNDKKFAAAKIVVAGDIMLDSYWEGKADRVSPEALLFWMFVANRTGLAVQVIKRSLSLSLW